jgi:hypothetical protein
MTPERTPHGDVHTDACTSTECPCYQAALVTRTEPVTELLARADTYATEIPRYWATKEALDLIADLRAALAGVTT